VATAGGCGRAANRHFEGTPTHPSPATSSPSASSAVGGIYLALGDSVPFGFREPTAIPKPNYRHPASFVGYPELVGAARHLTVVNAACPGETTASLLDAAGPSNGCENGPRSRRGYRSVYPLHVRYRGSQVAFATSYLRSHHNVRVVTLTVGANDGFRCQAVTADHCATELETVTQQVTHNIAAIARAVRAAGYTGPLLVVGYYTTRYRSLLGTVLTRSLDAAIRRGALAGGAKYVDGYAAFRRVALRAGGSSCAAGLLTRLTSGRCGIHPSRRGQLLLARAVERALG